MKQTLLFFFLIGFAPLLLAQKIEVVKLGDQEYIAQRDTTQDGDIVITYKLPKSTLASLEKIIEDNQREAAFFQDKIKEMEALIQDRLLKVKQAQEQINQLEAAKLAPAPQIQDPAPPAKKEAPAPTAKKPKKGKSKLIKN